MISTLAETGLRPLDRRSGTHCASPVGESEGPASSFSSAMMCRRRAEKLAMGGVWPFWWTRRCLDTAGKRRGPGGYAWGKVKAGGPRWGGGGCPAPSSRFPAPLPALLCCHKLETALAGRRVQSPPTPAAVAWGAGGGGGGYTAHRGWMGGGGAESPPSHLQTGSTTGDEGSPQQTTRTDVRDRRHKSRQGTEGCACMCTVGGGEVH